MNKKIISILLVSTLFLSACSKSGSNATPTTVPTIIKKQKLTDITFQNPPKVSLTTRPDGHELTMTIANIPTEVTKLEYEVLYKAVDGKTEIEKGLGDTVNEITSPIERKLLLGTASCTNGCKYRYDEGITGGSIKITYLTSTSGVNIYESTWKLNKSGKSFTVSLDK